MQSFIQKKDGGKTVAITGDLYRIVVSGKETDGKYALIDIHVGPGAGPPPHIHANEDETFYLLEGSLTFTQHGKSVTLGPGDLIQLERNVAHVFRNNTDKPARALVQVMPAGLDEFFTVCSMPHTPGQPAPKPTQEHIDRLMAEAPRYGIKFVEKA